MGLDGAMLFAQDALSEVVALYIEGQNVALGGDFFGNAIVEMAYSDGALSLSLDKALSTQGTAALGAHIKYAQLQCLCRMADHAKALSGQ